MAALLPMKKECQAANQTRNYFTTISLSWLVCLEILKFGRPNTEVCKNEMIKICTLPFLLTLWKSATSTQLPVTCSTMMGAWNDPSKGPKWSHSLFQRHNKYPYKATTPDWKVTLFLSNKVCRLLLILTPQGTVPKLLHELTHAVGFGIDNCRQWLHCLYKSTCSCNRSL